MDGFTPERPDMKQQDLPSWANDLLTTLPPLLERGEAALALHIGLRTLDRRLAEGSLAFTRSGGRVLIPRVAIVEHLARRAREAS
jgi:excisionase family DNA binding protein